MQIVAIGGGELRQHQTLAIDQFIVDLASKSAPNALFIPTASGDAPGYCETFRDIYGQRLGCKTDQLCLTTQTLTKAELQRKIDWADIIYVGGGNTEMMLQVWQAQGIDTLLRAAGQRGCILSGLSAGAICWFKAGLSDADAFATADDWQFRTIAGLNFSPYWFCPHVDSEQRHQPFLNAIQASGQIGIGADDGAAIWLNDDQYQVLTCLPNAAVGLYQPDPDGIDYQRFYHGQKLPVGAAC